MWATLAMTAALAYAPQQGDGLAVTNVRPTYGLFGAKRKDADAPKVLPGDSFLLSFDIDNLKVGADGLVRYSIGWELSRNGKVQLREKGQASETYNIFGGSSVPGFTATQLGTDAPPGKHTLTVIVNDLAAKTTKKITQDFEVLKKDFGLVRFGLAYPSDGAPAPPFGVTGQTLMVGYAALGFERDKKTKQPHVSTTLRVLENGKPVLAKPVSAAVMDAQPNFTLLTMNFILPLNRAGKFTVELTITDELASPKKTARHSFELTVRDPDKK